jgi:hypothetical protein
MTKKKTSAKRAAPLKSPAHKQSSTHNWAEQSAKLYQLPFAQGDVNQTSRQMQSMAEDAMKAGAEFMQKFMGSAGQGFDASKMMGVFDPSKMMGNFDASKMMGVFDPSKMMGNFDTSKMMAAFDPSKMMEALQPSKAGEKVFAYGKDSADQLQKSAAATTRAMTEATELSRENAEAAMECGNMAVTISKSVSSELINYANHAFAQNVELSKQIFNCRTLNDMFDLSSKFVKSNLDGFFNESMKVSELAFQGANELAEPVNERISKSTERLVKAVAA